MRAKLHLSHMNTLNPLNGLPYTLFQRNLEFVASRKDEKGFTRVWGYFLDRSNRIVVFWRHQAGKFTFKVSDTYAGDVTISDKVREKVVHGYTEIEGKALDRADELLRAIHHDFLDAKERGMFHA